jgi:ABC-type branched-subunit amino acid transport system ATPase component/predicted MFS family arabinose efflux permease
MAKTTAAKKIAAKKASDHVDEIHSAEKAVEGIEQSQERLRARARRILGVTGEEQGLTRLRDGIAESKVGWYPLVALGALIIVDQFQSFAFSILGPEISRALGVGKSLLAFLVLLKVLSIMVASLPLAAFVQRKPRRAVVAKVTGLVWALATLASGFVVSVWGLLLVLVVDGASTGSVESVHAPLVMDSYPTHIRMRALSSYRGAFAAGTVVAPLTVGFVTGVLDMSWRAVFAVMGVICLVAVAVASRLRDPGFGNWDTERVREEVRRDAGAEVSPEIDGDLDLGFFEIVRRVMLVPTIRRMLGAWAAIGVMIFPFYTFLFFFLDERWGMSPGARSLFFAFVWALSLPALALFGRRGEALFRQDPAKLMRFISLLLLCVVAGLAVGVAAPVFPLMVAGFALVFVVAALLTPAVNMIVLSLVPPKMRPHTSALLGIFLAGVGGIGGVLLLSGVDRRFGISGAIVSLCAPVLIAAWIVYRTSKMVPVDLDRMIDEIVEREELRIMQSAGVHLPMLACRHIDFSYGQLQVLFDVNFTVDDGEMVALLGTNGAGKSTLLRVISGLGLPSRGSVHFRGGEITYLDAERRLNLGINQIPGGRATFGPLSVVDNLRVFGHSLGRHRHAVDRGIDATMEAFPGLAERGNQLASTLSGGEQQMLALGKALILEPRILLIDELSLGLAPKIVGELLEMVRRINATGTAIVLVEQSVNIALALVDHAYFMEKGEIRFDGPAAELLERPDLLRSVFLEGATKGMAG